jgi:hypothetical protein
MAARVEHKRSRCLDLGFPVSKTVFECHHFALNFQPRTRFGPHDINVLIANGYRQIAATASDVRDWISPSDYEETASIEKPNLKPTVVISYSPERALPVDLAPQAPGSEAYRYFAYVACKRTLRSEQARADHHFARYAEKRRVSIV